jgi:hypothetical protein
LLYLTFEASIGASVLPSIGVRQQMSVRPSALHRNHELG